MKIAFIGTKGMNFGTDAFGGFETVVTELGSRLAAKGHEVIIYCRKNLYSTKVFPDKVKGVRLRFVGSIESKNFGTMSHSLVSAYLAVNEKIDIVLLFNLGLGLYIPLLKLADAKIVTHLDGVEWKRSKWGFLARSMFRIGALLNVKLADVLIADAEEIQKIYVKKFKCKPIVIPYGAEFRDDLDSSFIEYKGLKPFEYYLIATRFIPENHPRFIIEAFLKSKTDKPLVVLGKNYYKSKYENEIKRLQGKRVRFLGHIADRKHLLEFYKYSYCYIHGHSVGGTNPTMIEALANSCCILSLDTPFSREMLVNGTYGLFFTLRSEDLMGKINYVEFHPEIVETFRSRATKRITSYYNWNSVTRSYLELFESLYESK